MNRRLVTSVAAVAMLVAAGLAAQDAFAVGLLNRCGGANRCGGLFAHARAARCCGVERVSHCGGGLLAKLRARRAADCCTPEPACCEPAPAPCCEPAPAPCCEPAPAPCCEPAPCCGARRLRLRRAACCEAPVDCGGCGATVSGCANCGTAVDSGSIEESPAEAPPEPTPDAAADSPSA